MARTMRYEDVCFSKRLSDVADVHVFELLNKLVITNIMPAACYQQAIADVYALWCVDGKYLAVICGGPRLLDSLCS
jgi:hypothetical protein